MSRGRNPRRPLAGDDPAQIAARAALAELRGEIRGRFTRVPAPRAVPRIGLPAGWERSFDQLRERLATFGMRERSGDVDEFGMDEEALRALRPLLDFLFDRYWAVRVGGIEHLPEQGPCLLVANAAGILPYDALMIAHAVFNFYNVRFERPDAYRVQARVGEALVAERRLVIDRYAGPEPHEPPLYWRGTGPAGAA